MYRPVCPPICTQFSNHLHQHLESSLHLSVSLGMVWQSSHLPNAHELTQFADDVALNVGSSVTQELGQCSKDQDVSLPQKLSKSFAVWSGVTFAIVCLMKWSQKTKTFTMCGGWSSSIVVSMLVKSPWSSSKWEVTRIACSVALAWVSFCWIHLSWPLIAPASTLPYQATKMSLATGTVLPIGLDVLHPYGIHSWPPLYEPWRLQTT